MHWLLTAHGGVTTSATHLQHSTFHQNFSTYHEKILVTRWLAVWLSAAHGGPYYTYTHARTRGLVYTIRMNLLTFDQSRLNRVARPCQRECVCSVVVLRWWAPRVVYGVGVTVYGLRDLPSRIVDEKWALQMGASPWKQTQIVSSCKLSKCWSVTLASSISEAAGKFLLRYDHSDNPMRDRSNVASDRGTSRLGASCNSIVLKPHSSLHTWTLINFALDVQLYSW